MVFPLLLLSSAVSNCLDRRPPIAARAFTSKSVDAFLDSLSANMSADPELACLVRNTLPNTLDTTVRPGANVLQKGRATGDEDFTLIITGDINAMWLRDSTNQVLPYLPFGAEDEKLRRMLEGVLR